MSHANNVRRRSAAQCVFLTRRPLTADNARARAFVLSENAGVALCLTGTVDWRCQARQGEKKSLEWQPFRPHVHQLFHGCLSSAHPSPASAKEVALCIPRLFPARARPE